MLVQLNIMSWCFNSWITFLRYLQSHTGALLFVTCFGEPTCDRLSVFQLMILVSQLTTFLFFYSLPALLRVVSGHSR